MPRPYESFCISDQDTGRIAFHIIASHAVGTSTLTTADFTELAITADAFQFGVITQSRKDLMVAIHVDDIVFTYHAGSDGQKA